MMEQSQKLAMRAQRWLNQRLPRYVFIHINKTAGSSIERALNLRFEHKTALEKRAELGDWRWNRAYKFTFVRNPWDKVVSHYSYRVKTNQNGMGDEHIGFREWVLRAYGARDSRYYDNPKMFQPQWDWISDEEGKCLVDLIGRFETLQSDFTSIADRLRIQSALPHVKSSDRQNYRQYFDAETRDCIASHFERDLINFGYQF